MKKLKSPVVIDLTGSDPFPLSNNNNNANSNNKRKRRPPITIDLVGDGEDVVFLDDDKAKHGEVRSDPLSLTHSLSPVLHGIQTKILLLLVRNQRQLQQQRVGEALRLLALPPLLRLLSF